VTPALGVTPSSAAGAPPPSAQAWALTRVLRAPRGLAPFGGRFGAAVAASGTTRALGAPRGAPAAAGAAGAAAAPVDLGAADDAASVRGAGAVALFTLARGFAAAYAYADHKGHPTWTELAAWRAADVAVNASLGGDALAAAGGGAAALVPVADDGAGDGVWAAHAVLLPPSDAAGAGDEFGAALALDGDSLLVGAPGAGRALRVSWDFESGDLGGWRTSGTAFARQPVAVGTTEHHSSYATPLGAGAPELAGARGRWFVSTFEARPGDLADALATARLSSDGASGADAAPGAPSSALPIDPTVALNGSARAPIVSTAAGVVQGDAPTGALTSPPFLIRGSRISFLVGGGCDALRTFVELLIDGEPALRASGRCSTRLARVDWDVAR
jgi:hypothetical protein